MGKFIDLTGKNFSRLSVINYWGSENKRTYWNCFCSCGNKIIVSSQNLASGNTKSCGCLQKEITAERNSVNLLNERFGRLLVIKKLKVIGHQRWLCKCDCGNIIESDTNLLNSGKTKSCGCYKSDILREIKSEKLKYKRFGNLTVVNLYEFKNEASYWTCDCDCGNTVIVRASSLKSGNTKSCGCLNESYIASELKKYYKKYYNGVSEYKILKNPKTGSYLPYDIYLIKENIFIEINGEQHYKYFPHWHRSIEKFKYNKKLDVIKREYARKNGIYIEVDLRKIKTTQQAIVYIQGFIN